MFGLDFAGYLQQLLETRLAGLVWLCHFESAHASTSRSLPLSKNVMRQHTIRQSLFDSAVLSRSSIKPQPSFKHHHKYKAMLPSTLFPFLYPTLPPPPTMSTPPRNRISSRGFHLLQANGVENAIFSRDAFNQLQPFLYDLLARYSIPVGDKGITCQLLHSELVSSFVIRFKKNPFNAMDIGQARSAEVAEAFNQAKKEWEFEKEKAGMLAGRKRNDDHAISYGRSTGIKKDGKPSPERHTPHAPFVDMDLGPPPDAAVLRAGLEMQRDGIIKKAMEREEVGWDVLGKGELVEGEEEWVFVER